MVKTELNEERELGLNKTKDTSSSVISEEEVKVVKPQDSKKQTAHPAVTKTTIKDYTEILNLLREYDLKFLSHWTRTYNYQKWKTEHHAKCAFFDSGIVGHDVQEFYKERVSQGYHLNLGSATNRRVDNLRKRGQIQRHSSWRQKARQRSFPREPFQPHLRR
jgi:hypothetical protein